MVRMSHETAKEHGWWDKLEDQSIPTKIALIHSEASEALEDYRDGNPLKGVWYQYRLPEGLSGAILQGEKPGVLAPVFVDGMGESHAITPHLAASVGMNVKPMGFAVELADILIRVGDLAGFLGIDLDEAVRLKMAYNRTRPHRHGGKAV